MNFIKLKDNLNRENSLIDHGTIRVIALASVIMVVAVLVMGSISYIIAENAVVQNLKTKELFFIAQSIAAKIDGRIGRAKETSMMLAADPTIEEWTRSGEKSVALDALSRDKIKRIVQKNDYDNSFIVSAVTGHYWDENGKMIDTMSPNDPDDTWFYSTISSRQPISIVIDYNRERADTFVFVNALIGDKNSPYGVTGVGLSLRDITKEFQGYKFGEKSNMWLIDKKGDIYISEDLEHIGKNVNEFIPADVSKQVALQNGNENKMPTVLEYQGQSGKKLDLVYQSIQSTDWKLVFQIPRSESTSIVRSIKINTILASVITILLVVLVFYLVSHRIANPYKRAVLLSKELEKKVMERTQELNEKNTKIMDSIEYAKMIQESILPEESDLKEAFREHFVLWRPRDIVGGDFYWLRKYDNLTVLAVGDCTGHGVPGALMTMAVNSILSHIVKDVNSTDPALMLKELNRQLKQTLLQGTESKPTRDGLDAGIVCIPEGGPIRFAGARLSLYMKENDSIQLIKGDRKGIGYKATSEEYEFTCHRIEPSANQIFYLTTDGFIDQNGGDKDLPYGRKRFQETMLQCGEEPMEIQGEIFEKSLDRYRANEPQRDDITIIGFKPFI